MSTIMGGDFYEITGKTVPSGMVSEPPDYAECVAGMETLSTSSAGGSTRPTAAELRRKCEQLYQAVKQQTLAYLITAQVGIGQGAEQGLKVSNSEVEQAFRSVQAAQFPKPVELQRYLAARHWTLSDELFLVKRDVLSSKLRSKLLQKYRGSDGKKALIQYAHNAVKLWTARTNCRPGYVVEGCKQYRATQVAAIPPPAVLIAEIARPS
jgi:hypothetical protein